MKKLKTILYTIILSTFFRVGSVLGAFGQDKINSNLVGDTNAAPVVIQKYIVYGLQFLFLVAVIYGIYGGFLILTAGGDDEKVKKGRTVIIQSLIGIIVIYLAGPIVEFFLGGSSDSGVFTQE